MLVLLPTSTSKMLAQWQGPYQIVKRVSKVTYRRKRKRVFHVNMLREFHIHRTTDSNYWTDEVISDDSDDEVPVWNETPEGQPRIDEQLNDSQRQQLKKVLGDFA